MPPKNKLARLGTIAAAIQSQEFLDNTTVTQRRQYRKVADDVTKSLADDGLDVTVDVVLALLSGAAMQKAIQAREDPMSTILAAVQNPGKKPVKGEVSTSLIIVFAYLATDILEGAST